MSRHELAFSEEQGAGASWRSGLERSLDTQPYNPEAPSSQELVNVKFAKLVYGLELTTSAAEKEAAANVPWSKERGSADNGLVWTVE